ncbi:flagellar hook-basal body protein [Ruminococcaceae bacterium OttesenSCG-928-L11]|nr:flagellar hook-basal body protein [Ruminococcaceae bacterium OttesenSCG-928-L11]
MIRGFYSARSGLIGHQDHINTIANNISNVSTVGFKPMRTAFKDLIYQNLNRPDAEAANVGHGVKINKNDVMVFQGAPTPTGRSLDFALTEENAFFAVESMSGEIRYTRNGCFGMSNNDDTWYLINGSGEYVLDMDGERIEFEEDDDGNLTFDVETLGVFSFANPYGLWNMEGTTFYPTPESGEAVAIEYPSVTQSALENSAVEIAKEMADLVEASKAFSFSAKMLQTADEIEQTVNSLR